MFVKYSEIKNEIRHRIDSGELKTGDSLPGRNKLADTYSCSWATLNRAIQELILEGWLYAEKGKGTYVAERNGKTGANAAERSGKTGAYGAERSGKTGGQPDGFSDTIRVLLCHSHRSIYYSLHAMMEGIRQAAKDCGKSVHFIDLSEEQQGQQDWNGWIIVNPQKSEYLLLKEARRRGERFVVIGSQSDDASFSWVNADTRGGTRMGMRNLLERGHRNIALFGLKSGFSNYEQEILGFRDAFLEYGLTINEEYIINRPEEIQETITAFQHWIERHQECTAVFAADYTSALAILAWAMENHVSVPDELSLFTMDELPSSGLLRVPLTSVVQPFAEMGRAAVNLLLSARDNEARTVVLPCRMLLRESVGFPFGYIL